MNNSIFVDVLNADQEKAYWRKRVKANATVAMTRMGVQFDWKKVVARAEEIGVDPVDFLAAVAAASLKRDCV